MSAIDTLRTALFGSPPSPGYEPSRDGVLAAFQAMQNEIDLVVLGATVTVAKATRANLDADLVHAAGVVAIVYADATAANNDIYVKIGGSGSGSWTLTSILHDVISDASASYVTAAAASATAAAASAASLAPFSARLREHFHHSPNLFDPNAQTAGYFVNTSSYALTANAGWSTSDFIPVEEITTYVATHSSNSGAVGIVWYAADQTTVVGADGNYVAGVAVTSPVGAVYARYSYANGGTVGIGTLSNVGFYRGSSLPLARKAYGYTDDQDVTVRSQKQARAGRPKLVNLFSHLGITRGYFLYAATGAPQANSTTFYSDYIPVAPGSQICLNLSVQPGSDAMPVMFYDRDKALIGMAVAVGAAAATSTNGNASLNVTALGTYTNLPVGTPINHANYPAGTYITAAPAGGGAGVYTVSANATSNGSSALGAGGILAGVPMTVPEGVAFVRFSHFLGYEDFLELTDAARVAGDVALGWGSVLEQLPWAGKALAVLGDSSLAGVSDGGDNGWEFGYFMALFQHLTQANLVHPHATGGMKTRELLNGPATWGEAALISSDFGGASAFVDGGLLLGMSGTNDFGVTDGAGGYTGGRAIGTLGDTAASNTFYGDLYDIYINKLQTWQPLLTIVLVTPFPRFDDTAHSGDPLNAGTGKHLSDYVNAIKAFAAKWSLPCIDYFNESGINSKNYTATLIADALHPTYPFVRDRMVGRFAKFANRLA